MPDVHVLVGSETSVHVSNDLDSPCAVRSGKIWEYPSVSAKDSPAISITALIEPTVMALVVDLESAESEERALVICFQPN